MIVGFNINSIKAKTNVENASAEIKVNSTPLVVDIEKRDIEEMKDLLAIKFSFKVDYEPSAGEIKLEGDVLYKSDHHKEIMKRWKDSKTLPADIAVEVLNGIFRGCLIKAVALSADLRLPPPVRFPIVTKDQQAKKE